MSDEAHFHLNGMVNQQNCHYWTLENPRQLHAKPLHNPKMTVWCTVGKASVIGPYFFEDNNDNAVTLNSEHYTEMIDNLIVPELRWKHVPIWCVWFQQNRAIAPSARASMDVLCLLFSDCLFPGLLPLLGPLPFVIISYLKAHVYKHKPYTLEDLKEGIHVEVAQIDWAMLERAEVNFQEHLQKCINENGHHMKDIVFQTWIYQMLIQCEHSDINTIYLKHKLMILWNFQNWSFSLSHLVSLSDIDYLYKIVWFQVTIPIQ